MDAFASFHAPGFWLVMAVLGGVVVLGVRPFLPTSAHTPIILSYWLLLPYLALLSGGVSPRLMGLIYIDWAISLRIGVGLAFGLIALALGMRAASTSVHARTNDSTEPRSPQRTWLAVLTIAGLCGAEEFFWAFLRGAVTELLISPQFSLNIPDYWAIWIAAGLAAPITLINASGGYSRLIKAAILILSSIVFFYTRNFWLCWVLHAAIWLIFSQSMRISHPAIAADAVLSTRTPATEKSQSQ